MSIKQYQMADWQRLFKQACQNLEQLCLAIEILLKYSQFAIELKQKLNQNEGSYMVLIGKLRLNLSNMDQFCQKIYATRQAQQIQINLVKRELALSHRDFYNLEVQYENLKKEFQQVSETLNNKQLQINELKAFNKVEISFVESIQINCRQQKQKNSTQISSSQQADKLNIDQEDFVEEFKMKLPQGQQDKKIENIYDLLQNLEKEGKRCMQQGVSYQLCWDKDLTKYTKQLIQI